MKDYLFMLAVVLFIVADFAFALGRFWEKRKRANKKLRKLYQKVYPNIIKGDTTPE